MVENQVMDVVEAVTYLLVMVVFGAAIGTILGVMAKAL